MVPVAEHDALLVPGHHQVVIGRGPVYCSDAVLGVGRRRKKKRDKGRKGRRRRKKRMSRRRKRGKRHSIYFLLTCNGCSPAITAKENRLV